MSRDDATAAPRVVHLDRREVNALELGDELYLFLAPGDPALVPARCPHRGGPLHLAAVDAQGAALVCPWHGTKVPLRALRRRAVATVQSGPCVRAVIEAPASAALLTRHLPVHLEGPCARACRNDDHDDRDDPKGSPTP